MTTFQHFQSLIDHNRRWGQVTIIKFINRDVTHTGTEWICFGTGRGHLLVYHRSRKSVSEPTFHLFFFLMHSAKLEFKEYIHQEIFGAGDSVESFAFDPSAQNFAITSHYGRLQVLRIEDGKFAKLWVDTFVDVIPRAVSFTDKGASIIIYMMESGMV